MRTGNFSGAIPIGTIREADASSPDLPDVPDVNSSAKPKPEPPDEHSPASWKPEVIEESSPPAAAVAASTGGPDILREFALPANYNDAMAGVKRHLAIVNVTKPKRTWWYMVHPQYVLQAGIYVDDATSRRENYLVSPELVLELGDDVARMTLHGALTRQGVFFIIPVRLPGPDGRIDTYNASMREAIVRAQSGPVRTASNNDAGCYDIYTAPGDAEFPAWPDESWGQLLALAFKDKIISDSDHPVLRRLRGEI